MCLFENACQQRLSTTYYSYGMVPEREKKTVGMRQKIVSGEHLLEHLYIEARSMEASICIHINIYMYEYIHLTKTHSYGIRAMLFLLYVRRSCL